MNRREFLRNSSLLAGSMMLISPQLLSAKPKFKPRKISPNEKVNIACIGIGNRGGEIIKDLYKTGLCNVVALCDTDMGANHTLEIINQFTDAKHFHDFRIMFDKMANQIDAVCIGTPDHSHFLLPCLQCRLENTCMSKNLWLILFRKLNL